mmetsp:Transcript_4417/g.16720  ORF Transcript_4417/g.16720 Transcript_4417/m.16720 type:complete len:445 (+) Transcript_4417:2175-3509(+)
MRLQDVDRLEANRIVPSPAPICRRLLAQVDLTLLCCLRELSLGSLEVLRLRQRAEDDLLRRRELLAQRHQPRHRIRLLRVDGLGLDSPLLSRCRRGAPAVAQPGAAVVDRWNVLARQALAPTSLGDFSLDLAAEDHDEAIALHLRAEDNLAVQVVPLLDALWHRSRHGHSQSVVHPEHILAIDSHELQSVRTVKRLPKEQLSRGLVGQSIDPIQGQGLKVSDLLGPPGLRIVVLLQTRHRHFQQLLHGVSRDKPHARPLGTGSEHTSALLGAADAQELRQSLAIAAGQAAGHAAAARGPVADALLDGTAENEHEPGVVISALAEELAGVEGLPDELLLQRRQAIRVQIFQSADFLVVLVPPSFPARRLELVKTNRAQQKALELVAATAEHGQGQDQDVLPGPRLAEPRRPPLLLRLLNFRLLLLVVGVIVAPRHVAHVRASRAR